MFWLIAIVPGAIAGCLLNACGFSPSDWQFWVVMGAVACGSAITNGIRRA